MLRVVAFLCAAAFAFAARAAERPDLVIVIAAERFAAEHLEKHAPQLSERGFNRFLLAGVSFPNAKPAFAVTTSGPGHASIAAGTTPSEHGIVASSWIDREAGTPRDAAHDDRARPPVSPIAFGGDSLGERLKQKNPESRVMAVGIDPTPTVLLASRAADAAYWLDPALPGFVTSTYYLANPTVTAFNKNIRGYLPQSGQWKPLPRSSATFAHPVADLRALTRTPFAHDLTLDFAIHILTTESLGANTGTPDLLYIALPPIDAPSAAEMTDSVLRLDRALERFMDAVSRRVPEGKLLVAFTSDRAADAKKLDLKEHASLVAHIAEPSIWLDWNRVRARKLDAEQVKRTIRDAIGTAWTNTQLLTPPAANASDAERTIRASFRADRSGDVLFLATSPARVPLLFWGEMVKENVRVNDAASPADLAKTIGGLLGVEVGGRGTRALPAFR